MSDLRNKRRGVRTWIEVDKDALESNYNVIKGLLGDNDRLCAVVKSNAYSFGLVQYSKLMSSLGVDYLAVDSVVEGLRLRKEGIERPILVLGYTLPEMIEKAAKNDIEMTASTFEFLQNLPKQLGQKVRIHIKADTGMRRQGFLLKQKNKVIEELKKNSNIEVVGLYTHLAGAGTPGLEKETKTQINEFVEWKKLFEKEFGEDILVHAANSSAFFSNPESHFDMVRIGNGLNGCWSSLDVAEKYSSKVNLKPAFAWKSIISEVKNVRKGERIGYDLTEEFSKDSKVAVVPLGYWHGYDRRLSGKAHVLVDGKRCKVMGRVSMDMISIDVTCVEAHVGDEVALLGKQGNEEITVEELAGICGTINHEILTRLNPLVRKIYI